MVEENLIKRLMSSIRCSVCGQRYGESNIKVLGHHDDLWFLRTFCPACHTRCLVTAVVKEGEVSGVTTDLTEAETKKFRDSVAPTADEVLDMHNFLKDFEGDVHHLFHEKRDI